MEYVAEKKPSILDVSIVYESGLERGETLLFGLEKPTGRLYIFEFNEYIGELGDWMAGRFLMKNDSGKWQSNHALSISGPVVFDSYKEIAKYWNENMVLHPGPSRGTKEYEDSILNSYICEMSEGMSSLSHVG
tara:strand:+ start:1025 stop:1423 length:399 start_codon:yes stop_codon:yes gene_type:complete